MNKYNDILIDDARTLFFNRFHMCMFMLCVPLPDMHIFSIFYFCLYYNYINRVAHSKPSFCSIKLCNASSCNACKEQKKAKRSAARANQRNVLRKLVQELGSIDKAAELQLPGAMRHKNKTNKKTKQKNTVCCLS